MFEASHLSANRDLMMNSILYEYLFLLASKFPREQYTPGEKQISYVEETLTYLETNYSNNISVQSLADSVGLNRSYLHRLFKSATGSSLKEYLLDLRIRKACSLLKSTDLPVAIISHSVGYEDTLYFSRLFKKKKGLSPSQYRVQKPNNK